MPNEILKAFSIICEKAFHVVRCAPEGSRTPNLLIRSQVLYPIKLQVPFLTDCKNMLSFQSNIVFLKISKSVKNQALKFHQRISFLSYLRDSRIASKSGKSPADSRTCA